MVTITVVSPLMLYADGEEYVFLFTVMLYQL